MVKIILFFCFIMTGCGFKTHYIVPDKLAIQVNTDPNKDGKEYVDQVRFGLSWDIPQPGEELESNSQD